jgi:multiple sugar transport system substrate-binding protein
MSSMKGLDLQQRLYLARMAGKLKAGRIDRREFIRAAAIAGFGIASARYLTGCAVSAPAAARPASEPAIGVTEQQHFLAEVGRHFRGTRIKIVSEDTPPGLAISRMMKTEFTDLTGIEVDWEIVPLDQVLARTLEDTVAGTRGDKGQCDVYYWDQAWLARFADDCIPIDELLAKRDLAYPGYDFDDFLPQLVDKIASHEGKRIGVPFDIPIFIMMYRKDIFDELRLDIPKTMAAYMSAVKTIHEAMRGRGIYGTVGQWKSGHFSLQCDASAWTWSHGGHHFGSDGKPDYVSEANVRGLEYMMELGRSMDPAVTGWDWNGEGSAFRMGNAGVVISWGEFFPGFDDPAASKVAGLVEAADCPREAALLSPADCGYGETPGISRQGGSCLALSRHAPNADAGWLFMQWATSADVIARANTHGANTPIRRSSFTDPRVLAMNKPGAGTTRHFAVTRRAIESRMGTSPHLPAWSALASSVNAEEYGKMTTGQQSIRTTLETIQKKTEGFLRQSDVG